MTITEWIYSQWEVVDNELLGLAVVFSFWFSMKLSKVEETYGAMIQSGIDAGKTDLGIKQDMVALHAFGGAIDKYILPE
ncbi:hypothetical protein [Paenibacillus sp. NFR01]|uniref:hypothetical protein n=1 Tax=Paenibacillus sp. NFR01 TaxID=1566279 RepID=UPI0008CA3CD8|nr:hypothetical protein [Paenibacillus sp. NFR01]SEU32827.1 hypothetical protein SAMN03159358_0160 [Paenibacillus sp. NFR01]